MRVQTALRFSLATTLVLFLASPAALRAGSDDWKPLRKKAKAAITQPGGFNRKVRVIAALSREDHAKAAEMLVNWSIGSLTFVKKVLGPTEEETGADFAKTERMLLKTFDKMPPSRPNDKNLWKAKKAAWDVALANVQAEDLVQTRIGQALARMTSKDSARWLAAKGLKKLRKVDGTVRARIGAVRALLACEAPGMLDAAISAAHAKSHPEMQVDVLRRLGEIRPKSGIPALLRGLQFKHPVAQRAAIAALRSYNDPKSVEGIIKAFTDVTGTPAEELEALLHHFTGQSFDADGRVWKQWWADKGAAWLASVRDARHPPREATRASTGTTFYDIPTKSQRIVFVLDRSGSMSDPANMRKRAEAPKGPVTGGDPMKPMDVDAGSTRIEVAKRELERSIRGLSANVHFNLVFYSNKVEVWQDPPRMLPATAANKEAAIQWFTALDAAGGTALFDAIMRALEYAVPAQSDEKGNPIEGGADTIFLLSDGSPTAEGKLLPADVQDALLTKFLEANKTARCVVHTIGIGKGHSKKLMPVIAKKTGGEYRSVGE